MKPCQYVDSKQWHHLVAEHKFKAGGATDQTGLKMGTAARSAIFIQNFEPTFGEILVYFDQGDSVLFLLPLKFSEHQFQAGGATQVDLAQLLEAPPVSRT